MVLRQTKVGVTRPDEADKPRRHRPQLPVTERSRLPSTHGLFVRRAGAPT